jgi:hypothetical protein
MNEKGRETKERKRNIYLVRRYKGNKCLVCDEAITVFRTSYIFP